MSTSLQHYQLVQEKEAECGPGMESEFGWPDVATGLWKVLTGYGIIIVSVFLLLALVIGVGLEIEAAGGMKKANQGLVAQRALLVFGGLAIAGLVCLLGYYMILAGKWKCLMHVPERYGARWFMFASITCIVMGPALGFATGFLSESEKPTPQQQRIVQEFLKTGKGADKVIAINKTSFYLNLASTVISIMSFAFFVLFLRAVAYCFQDRVRIWFANGYLMIAGTSAGMILAVGALQSKLLEYPLFVLAIAGFMVMDFVFFLVVLFLTAQSISANVKYLYGSPLDT
jgi:hypothetical protein